MTNERFSSFPVTDLTEAVSEILEEGRRIIDDAVDDLMAEAFERVCALIKAQEESTGKSVSFNSSVCGLSRQVLEEIYSQSAEGSLTDWILNGASARIVSLRMAFLNYDRMRILDFKSSYPRAFTKWTEEEDAEVLRLYHAALAVGTPGSQRIPWTAISKRLGRNINAVKLRLGHLGIDLGPDAGIPRHTRITAGVKSDN